jgi:glycosyltransferase 2 family protein
VKLFIKIFLSLSVGVLCLWLALRKMDLSATASVLRNLPLSAVLIYAATMVPTHLFRAWRWKYLLRPLGVSLSFGRLMLISTVGFMAILALPFRLGEFVRPYYVVRGGQSRMSAMLGTVAVERIVDGLAISILFFVTYIFASFRAQGPGYSSVLAGAAWLSLLGFLGLTIFLACALRWTEKTIRLALTMTLLQRFAPALSERISDKLRALIQGFRALREPRDMLPFLFQTVLYWFSNGFGMWLLARDMQLMIPMTGAFAAMAFTGVVISLPNSPGLVGQFHAGVLIALGAYLPAATVSSFGGAYAVALHGIQFVWYVGLGFLALFAIGGGSSSLRTMVVESKRAAEQGGTT